MGRLRESLLAESNKWISRGHGGERETDDGGLRRFSGEHTVELPRRENTTQWNIPRQGEKRD